MGSHTRSPSPEVVDLTRLPRKIDNRSGTLKTALDRCLGIPAVVSCSLDEISFAVCNLPTCSITRWQPHAESGCERRHGGCTFASTVCTARDVFVYYIWHLSVS